MHERLQPYAPGAHLRQQLLPLRRCGLLRAPALVDAAGGVAELLREVAHLVVQHLLAGAARLTGGGMQPSGREQAHGRKGEPGRHWRHCRCTCLRGRRTLRFRGRGELMPGADAAWKLLQVRPPQRVRGGELPQPGRDGGAAAQVVGVEAAEAELQQVVGEGVQRHPRLLLALCGELGGEG